MASGVTAARHVGVRSGWSIGSKYLNQGSGRKLTTMALHSSGVRDTACVPGIGPQTVMSELKNRRGE